MLKFCQQSYIFVVKFARVCAIDVVVNILF